MQHHHSPRIMQRVFICDECGGDVNLVGFAPEVELALDMGYTLAQGWAETFTRCEACWLAEYAAGVKPVPGDVVIDLTDGGAR